MRSAVAAPHDGREAIQLLLRKWKWVALGSTIAVCAAVAYALLATQWFQAQLVAVPAHRPNDISTLGAAMKLPFGLDRLASEAQRIEAVLISRSVADAVIEKFGLREVYEVSSLEEARESLWNHCRTSVDRRAATVSVLCEDTDPDRVAMMLRYFGEVGNEVFEQVSVSSALEERTFFEAQVHNARREVEILSVRIRDFQMANSIVDLPVQSRAALSEMSEINGLLVSKELELSYNRGFSSDNAAKVLQLEEQIAGLESKLRELEALPAPSGAAKAGTFFPNALDVPAFRFQLEQLVREHALKEAVYTALVQRYELAKVDEARDTSTFQILDMPTTPTLRSRPQRRRIVMLAGLFGFVASCAAVIFCERRSQTRASLGVS